MLIECAGTQQSVIQFMGPGALDPHFKFVILGRTKGVQEDGHKFAIPCVKETQGTHLRPGIWLDRLLTVKREMGQTHGKLFKRSLRRAKLCEFEDDFYRMIERIQDTTNHIPSEVDVRNDDGVSSTKSASVSAYA